MDIEKEITKIIKKYAMETKLNDVICNYIGEFLKAECLYKKVGIMCGGEHTQHLLSDFGNVLNIVCIFDNDKRKIGSKIEQIPVCDIKEVRKVDCIVISSLQYRCQVREQLLREGVAESDLIDIYDYIGETGSFAEVYYHTDNVYWPFIFMNRQYDRATKKIEREKWLRELIKGYLDIRDIYSAKECINLYIGQDYYDSVKMESLLREIDLLINKIKIKMQSRTQRDIIWFWQDALCYQWIEYMPFYNEECRERGLFFTNVYSMPNSTRWTYELIFHKRYEIDDKAYIQNENDSCKWLEKLQKLDYDCVRVPTGEKNEIQSLREFNFREKLISLAVSTSQLFWTALDYIINNNRPVFFLIHTAIETHQPCCSPSLKTYSPFWCNIERRFEQEINELLYKNIKINCKYLNNITKFYSDLFGENTVKVYMSDHGVVFKPKSNRWSEEATHCNFIVVGKDIPARKCEDLFGFYNFDRVIDYILQPSERRLERIFSTEIKLQGIDSYNKNFIETFIKVGKAEYGISFRGIRTKEDEYILLRTGEEFYYRLPDDVTNYINDSKYEDRIRKLKEKAGTYFIDIDLEEKFQYTHILYDFLKQKSLE